MEEEEKEAVIGKCPGKLNFNAPLLSIRRPIGTNRLQIPNANSLRLSWDNCERIPFSWEQTPGKPKDMTEASDTENIDNILPPKPPPGRWLPAKEALWECDNKVDSKREYDEDGCQGDGDDEDRSAYEDCKDDDVSSNALDIFSLAQSVDTVETWDKLRRKLMIGNLDKDDLKGGGIGSHSPNFMIQRFLPDAKALAAASSALALSKDINENKYPKSNTSTCTGSITSVSRAINLRESKLSASNSKGCGLDIFFPWRLKPKPCGTKCPVVSPVASKPQRSRRK